MGNAFIKKHLCPEKGGIGFPRNVYSYLRKHTVSDPISLTYVRMSNVSTASSKNPTLAARSSLKIWFLYIILNDVNNVTVSVLVVQ